MKGIRSDYMRGALLIFGGVMILGPEALLIRLIGTELKTRLFWRGLLSGFVVFAYLGFLKRGLIWSYVMNIGRIGIVIAVFQALQTILFTVAVHLTATANIFVIFAATPLFAAIFSRLFLGERISRQTWISVVVGFFGILLLFMGRLGDGAPVGDILTLIAACLGAGCFVLARKARHVDMVPATGLYGFIMALTMLLSGAQLGAVAQADIGYLLLLSLFVAPVSYGLIILGPRYLPAPEASLIMMLETLVAPLWVWFVLSEVPPVTTVAAGTLILGTLLVQTLSNLRLHAE